MSTAISRVKALTFGVESTFSNLPFTALSDAGCLRLPVEKLKLDPSEERLKRETELAGLGHYQGITGVKGGKITFSHPLISPAMGGTAGSATGTAGPFDLKPASSGEWSVLIDSRTEQDYVFGGTQAHITGTSATYAAGGAGDSLTLTVNGVTGIVVDLSAVANTELAYIDAITAAIQVAGGNGYATDSGGQLKIVSNQYGTGSFVKVTAVGGSAATTTGLALNTNASGTATINLNSGGATSVTIADMSKATAAELVTALGATTGTHIGASGDWATIAASGSALVLTSVTTGTGSKVQTKNSSTVELGFDTTAHTGTASSTGITGSSTSINANLLKLLPACGLTRVETSGTTLTGNGTQHGTTSTDLPCTDSSGIPVGSVIGMVNTNGDLELRVVTANAGAGGTPPQADTITVEPAFSFTPQTGAQVYGCIAWTPVDAGTTVSFVAIMDGYAYVLTGCKGSFKLTGKGGQRWMMDFTFEVDGWVRAAISSGQFTITDPSVNGGSATTFSLSGLPALPTDGNLIAAGSKLYYDVAAGNSTSLSGEATFDQGWKPTAISTTEGRNARSGWAFTDANPVLETKPLLASAFSADFDSASLKTMIMQFGKKAGHAAAVVTTSAQISAYPNETDLSGIVGHDLKMELTAVAPSPATGAFSGPPTVTAANPVVPAYVLVFA